jgi:hypothetical protein
MLNFNQDVLDLVVEEAKQKTGGDSRWVNAITRAAEEIRTNPYLHLADGALLVLSSTSSNIYTANGTCQCKAFGLGQACWHRAAHRLVNLYNETAACDRESAPTAAAPRTGGLGGEVPPVRVERQRTRVPVSSLISSRIEGGRRIEHVRGIRI